MRIIISFLLMLITLGGTALAQEFRFPGQAGQPLPVEEAFRIELLSAGDGRAEIAWRIAPGYYLYRDNFSARDETGAEIEVQTFPGLPMDDPTFGQVEVHYDQAQIVLPRAGGAVTVTWQGCQEDGICYRPIDSRLDLPALPVAAGTPGAEGPGAEGPGTAGSGPEIRLSGGNGLVADLSGRGGVLLVLAGFFGFGLLLSLTPCTFPMIPILAGMLAREGETLTATRGAVLSGAYILAMAAAFAVLGGVAGWSGRNLQMLLQSPWAIGTVSVLFVALALASFGLFNLPVPAFSTRLMQGGGQLQNGGRRGSVGRAAGLGFTSALIIGPCITAPLAGALLYIAQGGDVALGAGALFALGLGQGLPLFVAGTFGAHLLPRAGRWMDAMRRIFGVVFLGMAIWLSGRILPGQVTLALWALLLAGSAVFLGVFDRPDRRWGQIAGVVMLFAAGVLGFGAVLGATDPLRPLAPLTAGRSAAPMAGLDFATIRDTQDLHAAVASAPGQPAMIYVTADWCVICRGIERDLWTDPGIAAALAGVSLLELDVTAPGREPLMAELGIAGPPTMIFLDGGGAEPEGSRMVGATSRAAFLTALALTRENGQ